MDLFCPCRRSSYVLLADNAPIKFTVNKIRVIVRSVAVWFGRSRRILKTEGRCLKCLLPPRPLVNSYNFLIKVLIMSSCRCLFAVIRKKTKTKWHRPSKMKSLCWEGYNTLISSNVWAPQSTLRTSTSFSSGCQVRLVVASVGHALPLNMISVFLWLK